MKKKKKEKQLKVFKTFNRLFLNGKPVGKEFVFHNKLLAKNKSFAIKEIKKVNRLHNKQFITEKGPIFSVKNTRVKMIRVRLEREKWKKII